ncbi:hypothetical protein ACIQUQ_03055 [Streptomyces sp. NPDC101118]|uniref:hypothetical protein n=1 Tax=Streptomyces sp. NPDC101118 TaxID=3366109 RepID=UPI00380B5B39
MTGYDDAYAPDFRPTHVVPQEGLPAWEAPDVSRPTEPLDPFLPVQLLARRGEWGQILCANGWSAWVDGRLLVAVPQAPPTGGRPLSRTENPQPLLDRSAEALERYRRAAADLAAGRTDAEGFRRATRGLRTGIVVDGEDVWVYDDSAGRWMYGEGSRLTTYAAAGPGERLSGATPETPPAAGTPPPAAPPAPGAPPAATPAPERGGSEDETRPAPSLGHEPTRVTGVPDGPGDR